MSLMNIQRYYSSEIFGMFARAFSYIGGGLVIVLAYSVYATGMSVEFISEWALNVLGLSFIVLLAALLFGAVLALLKVQRLRSCLLYTSPSPRDATLSRMPSSA